MKTCTKCGIENPLTEFYKHPNTRDGLQSRCKVCTKADAAKWSGENPEKVKESSDKYRAANTEKLNARTAKWQAENPDKRRGKVSNWRAANPDATRVHDQNRRTRNIGKLSKMLVGSLFRLQQGKCACGCKRALGDDYHLDHIMPLALGGTNTDSNIQLLRAQCNLQKHAKHPVDFMQSRGFLL